MEGKESQVLNVLGLEAVLLFYGTDSYLPLRSGILLSNS